MKAKISLALTACAFAGLFGLKASAQEVQETVVVVEEATEFVVPTPTHCKNYYFVGPKDNWFIQIGGGFNSAFMENYLPDGTQKHHLAAYYNVGFGKWFSPYIGWRLGFNGGALHWDNQQFNTANMVNANFDFMWDMFNTLGGVNAKRVFSIVPFVGFGGAFMWDYSEGASMIARDNGKPKSNSWALPLSAGLQFRFRLSKYADFFLEGRAMFAGDNWNNQAVGAPIDMNLSAIAGFSFYIGGTGSDFMFTDGDYRFRKFNPCDYSNYIRDLNDEVNKARRGYAEALAELEALRNSTPDCVQEEVEQVVIVQAPLLTTVRFTINSAKISNEEMVNVYNMAQYLNANPDTKLVITGYADKDTGTGEYNLGLSKRRADAVHDALVNKYGINPGRLATQAEGSSTQVYPDQNNWNRIVVFSIAQ